MQVRGMVSWKQAVGLCACLALLAASLGTALADTPERVLSFGPDGTEASDFVRVSGIAVDQQEGSAYVLDSVGSSLYRFDASGQPLPFTGASSYIEGNRIDGLDPFSPGEGGEIARENASQVAVDSNSHTVYVTEKQTVRAFLANGEPAEFSAGPGAGTSEIPGFTELYGVAVDPNGNIYASDHAGTVSVFAPSGALLTSFSVAKPHDLAVTGSGAVYVVVDEFAGSTSVKKFTPDSLPVTASTVYTEAGSIASGNIIGLSIDPVANDVYVTESNGIFGRSWIRVYDESGSQVESIGEPGTPSGESLELQGFGEGVAVWGEAREVSESETIKLYVDDGGWTGEAKVSALGSKKEIGPPGIEKTSALDVTADSATLRAWVDPNTAETTYHFEFGTEDCAAPASSCTSLPLGGASIGDGEDPVEVKRALSGLEPNTTYYYWVVAENEHGLTEGEEGKSRTFTTQGLGLGLELIDSRAWEMVSPPNKYGGELEGSFEGHIQAAADGQGLAYLSLGSIEPDPDGNRVIERSSVLAEREDDRWTSRDIMPANVRVIQLSNGHQGEYKLFSTDLSRALLEPRDGTALSPQASERTPYVRENSEPPLYTPLVTGKEGFANVPPGTEFGGGVSQISRVRAIGATPDLSQVVLQSEGVALAEGAPTVALYLWRSGQLHPLSVLPDDEGAGFVTANTLGSGRGSVQHAISVDGSRAFWSAGQFTISANQLTALYLRDTVAEETVRIDVPQPGASGAGTANPIFLGASADGTVVFFTDSRQLTADASPEGRELYRCEFPPGSPPAGCASLTAISAPSPESGESAEVLGTASGLSEDGTTIYFVAMGALDTEANQYGESAAPGEPNLYLWEEGEGVRFLTTLEEGDEGNWGFVESEVNPAASNTTAAASPSGRYLSFTSRRSLTGYGNLDAASGKPVHEVFRYDALEDRLDCVSCNPSGAAPEVDIGSDGGEAVGPLRRLVDPRGIFIGKRVAAVLPQATLSDTGGRSLYRPRAVLDNGRVFFNAIDSLVAADSNGEWDVYQYEPDGIGSCSALSGNAATALSAGGCVSLLSSGTADEEAGFLDASVSGEDVFFLTAARLSVTDFDDQIDVYDARVNGEPAVLEPRVECQGEACQAPKPAPQDQTPASTTFDGRGNVKLKPNRRCPKGKRKVRRKGKVRCVPRKHHNRDSRDHRAGQNGRAGR